EHAWGEFVDIYSPILYAFVRGRSLQPSDAADVTQEVLLRVAGAIQRFEYDPGRGLFRDWVARIVMNEIRRQVKKNGRHPANTEFLDDQTDDSRLTSEWNDHFQQAIFQAALKRCRPSFTDSVWELFERTWINDEPIESVVQQTGCSREQIYVARSRVLKRLRQDINLLADDLI
ncbi:MAG: sigma-70 family RNA polymerase sigma factor, partial [Planctomycetota bacterium]